MSALDTIAELRYAFYRAIGTVSGDKALTEQGESADDVAYLYLTRGIRAGQRWLIDNGMSDRWRKRSSAITSWTGSDADNGGRYVALSTVASDFLRLFQRKVQGQRRQNGGLVKANGDAWGSEIDADADEVKGDFYYLKNHQVWLARTASPPTTLYLDFFYQHPALAADTASFDFPTDAMPLVLWEAVDAAKDEAWFPGGPEAEVKIEKGLAKARREARAVGRQTRTPRRWGAPTRYGTRW